MNKIQNTKLTFAIGFIVLAAISRFIPHPPNFTPIMAMSIYGGLLFADKKYAFIVPILAMIFTDAFIGFHNTIAFVYGAFIIGVILGFFLKSGLKLSRLAIVSLLGSVIFFILTNFGAWLMSGLYPLTLEGLMQAYFFGLPFFSYSPLEMFGFTLLGDLFFNFLFFFVISLSYKYIPKYILS